VLSVYTFAANLVPRHGCHLLPQTLLSNLIKPTSANKRVCI